MTQFVTFIDTKCQPDGQCHSFRGSNCPVPAHLFQGQSLHESRPRRQGVVVLPAPGGDQDFLGIQAAVGQPRRQARNPRSESS